jgi:hypothetical protein
MIRRVVAVLAGVLTTLAIATPAYAHGGQGVTATVTYEQDGYPVTGQVDLRHQPGSWASSANRRIP